MQRLTGTTRRIVVLVLVAAGSLIAALPLGSLPVRGALAASVPSGLPSHFGIGLSAHPDTTGLTDWMPTSGIPWDYAYQYLSGGVNTNSGWETWNASGQFALSYAQSAASHGYIPVFPYYELLESSGTCSSCGEAQKDLSNLNNTGTMASYFQNFTLLMKRLGAGTYDSITGYGKTAIVQIEPDLSGHANQAVLNTSGNCYGYCTAQGNNPANLKAAVASSGAAGVAGFPNTYQGFNWALLHLRDLYAPNVLLVLHLSNWATSTDVGSSTDPSLNASALGQQAGSFAAQSGISGVPSGSSTYDLLFNDVLDRDAAYYKNVYGNPNLWWDRLNVTVPNFHRWESYIGAATQATGRSVIVWQIPEGNQYFASDNNTDGHYQDNRAEYFFSHIGELATVGIIGLIFGAGNGGSTVHFDGKKDGITNPSSMCTSDGMSTGQLCTTHISTVSDDDGGYIRMQGQQYYAGGGFPLGGGSSPPVTTAGSTQSYGLNNNDGSTWVNMDPNTLTLTVTPSTACTAILSANADLWTATPGFNQDLGINVAGGSYGAGQIVAWKESGGFSGTYSPNAAFVHTVQNLQAGVTYTIRLQWKSNKAGISAIRAGAGSGTTFSPTRLTSECIPTSSSTTVTTASSTQQYALNNSGAGWVDMDPSAFSLTVTPTTACTAIIAASTDLWTATAGFNQDIGIWISGGSYGAGQIVAWKESGGFAGTYSPNAAFVHTVQDLQAGVSYTMRLQWKTNKPGASAIRAGAGGGAPFSPTRLTSECIPSGSSTTVTTANSTQQYTLNNSNGASWVDMDPNALGLTITPTTACVGIISANADLWTATAGFNQDIGIWIAGGSYGAGQVVAWKESGGFAGTYSPNAAFVHAVQNLQSGVAYTIRLQWKTNKPGVSAIRAAAGGGAPFSPTRLTVLCL